MIQLGAGSRWPSHPKTGISMLETIAVVLLVLWLLGMVTSNLMGGFIHVLVVVAVVLVLLRLIRGARA